MLIYEPHPYYILWTLCHPPSCCILGSDLADLLVPVVFEPFVEQSLVGVDRT